MNRISSVGTDCLFSVSVVSVLWSGNLSLPNLALTFFYCPNRTGQSHKKCWENWKSKKVVASRFKDFLMLRIICMKNYIYTMLYFAWIAPIIFFTNAHFLFFTSPHIHVLSCKLHYIFISQNTFDFPRKMQRLLSWMDIWCWTF